MVALQSRSKLSLQNLQLKKKKDEILVRQVQIAGKLTLSRVNYEEKKKLTVDLLYKVEADIKT